MICCPVLPWKEAHLIVGDDIFYNNWSFQIFFIHQFKAFPLFIVVLTYLPFSTTSILQYFTCLCFCLKQGGDTHLRAECGAPKIKALPYRMKPPSTKATKSHTGRAEAMAQRVLNETMLKNLTILHTQHRAPPILIPISTIGKEWDHERKKEPHIGSKKRNKKNRKELIMLN